MHVQSGKTVLWLHFPPFPFPKPSSVPTGVNKCCVWLFSASLVQQDRCKSGGVTLGVCVCVYTVSPVLVLLVLLLLETCGTEPLAGQRSLHVLDLPPPQLSDGWTDETPLVQIHGSIQLCMKLQKKKNQHDYQTAKHHLQIAFVLECQK